jgi:hypothetical protein
MAAMQVPVLAPELIRPMSFVLGEAMAFVMKHLTSYRIFNVIVATVASLVEDRDFSHEAPQRLTDFPSGRSPREAFLAAPHFARKSFSESTGRR